VQGHGSVVCLQDAENLTGMFQPEADGSSSSRGCRKKRQINRDTSVRFSHL